MRDKLWGDGTGSCLQLLGYLPHLSKLTATTNLITDLFIFAPLMNGAFTILTANISKTQQFLQNYMLLSTGGWRVLRTGSIYSLLLASGSSEAGELLGSEPIPLAASFFVRPLQNREQENVRFRPPACMAHRKPSLIGWCALLFRIPRRFLIIPSPFRCSALLNFLKSF